MDKIIDRRMFLYVGSAGGASTTFLRFRWWRVGIVARVSSFMWLQSLVRDDADRESLFRLDVATQRVNLDKGPKDQAVIELTGLYHNLLRRWSEV